MNLGIEHEMLLTMKNKNQNRNHLLKERIATKILPKGLNLSLIKPRFSCQFARN